MADIGLISCVSTKLNYEIEAENLYTSPLFKYSKEYALTRLDDFYILSAKHGLVKRNQIIAPYEETLNTKSQLEKISWANKVFNQILKEIKTKDRLVFLAGDNYKEILNDLLIEKGYKTISPLNKLSIGRQLQWYKNFKEHTKRLTDTDKVYSIIERLKNGLSGYHQLSIINGTACLPQKGVYLFFEDGEYRTTTPFLEKITRIGTHGVSKGSNSTLWNRLRTHRGGIDKRGNHRGSIFRLHVGNSLINKNKLEFPTWGIGQNADKVTKLGEIELEKLVSEYIGKMKILWLNIQDESNKFSDRSYIEKNLIALLSSYDYKLDICSNFWLGYFNSNEFIKKSSLWNINYVDFKYDPRFIDILDYYTDVTIGKKPLPDKSIVPIEWHNLIKNDPQLKLFNDGEN